MSVVVAVAAPLIAWVYKAPTLTGVMLVCAPVFVLGALGRQFEVASEKSLQFRKLVMIECCAALSGCGAAIIGALLGWHAYSLALAALVNAAVRSLLAFVALSDGWRPSVRLRWADVRPYLGFGGATLTSSLVNQVNASIDLILGGRLVGLDALGFYSVPRSFVLSVQNSVNPVVTRVGFPVIAEVQHDREAVLRAYHSVVGAVAVVGAPIYAGIAVLSRDICQNLLGPTWADASTSLSILACWGYFRSLGNPAGALLLGVGRADVALKWNVALLVVYPTALWIGSGWGTIGLASSLLVTSMLLMVPGWRWLVFPYTHWRFAGFAKSTALPAGIAAAAWLCASAMAGAIEMPAWRIGATISVAFAAYLGTVWWFSPGPLTRLKALGLEVLGFDRR